MTSFYQELNKSGKMSDEKENAQSRASVDKWIFRLLLLLIGVMPLIVLANVEQVVSPLISNIDTLSSGMKGDLFTHYKALFVVVITIITGAMLLAKVFFMNGQIRKTPLNYAIGIFAVMIVLSTVFSPNITIALGGQYNRSDGAITWICYLALMFIAMNIEYPKNVVNYVMYTMMPFVLVNLFIITMNFYGKDLLQYGWMQSLVSSTLPEGASISEGSTLLGTLNHGNYMSGMFAILTLMYLSKSIVEHNIAQKVINWVMAVLAILVVLMSLSTSGFLTLLCMMTLILWLAIKNEKKVIAILQIVVFCGVTLAGIHFLSQENSKVWDETFGFFTSTNPYTEVEVSNQAPLDINVVELLGLNHKAYASENSIELPENAASGIGAGSGRIYIWTYVMELVKERPLVGYGLDSLIYNFQHYNKDARANLETADVIVDKPHNMYVSILYGTGIVGFISLIAMILYTVWHSIKEIINIKRVSNFTAVLAIGWLAFLFQAIFNDTLPGLGATLWIIVGLLIGISTVNKKEKTV
ncbi:O-antigen ligase family protein [Solibacillus cecembensis]|uniref:O-antigen ligase family protein n=1 Tax=Solibacillus cecembensis TaxID=459347 RepID=UPI003CFE6484